MTTKIALLFAIVAIASAQNGPTAASNQINLTPQQMFLAHQNVGNFACRVDSVQVVMNQAGDEDKMVISAEDLQSSLSQTATLEWAHVNQFFFSSIDGRNNEKILGAAGGDMGEFIHALEAYSRVTGVTLSGEDVGNLLSRFLKVMSRSKFFYETDDRAYRRLALDTGCQNLHIATIGDRHKQNAIIAQLATDSLPSYIGDPFINFLATSSNVTGVRTQYIVYALQAFHQSLWKTDGSQSSLCYLEVKGRVDPKALIHVKTDGYCVDQGLAPLISSQLCAGQTFIDHTDAVKLFRRELVNLVTKPGDNPQDVLAEFNNLAQGNLAKFWDAYHGLPEFTVTFTNSSPLLD
jgi:hypothetical protein